MASHPQGDVHFRDALEELQLTDTHFALHPQLNSCTDTSWIAKTRF